MTTEQTVELARALGWATEIVKVIDANDARAGRYSCLDEGLARAVLDLNRQLVIAVKAIEDAPHAVDCQLKFIRFSDHAPWSVQRPCNCWKSTALESIRETRYPLFASGQLP